VWKEVKRCPRGARNPLEPPVCGTPVDAAVVVVREALAGVLELREECMLLYLDLILILKRVTR
jgi:hypothetical protein